MIHTAGPVWHGGKNNEEELLANCYRNSLKIAVEKGIKSIAFPAISTGVYHFPVEKATEIAISETKKFLNENNNINKVIFVAFDEKTFNVYNHFLNSL